MNITNESKISKDKKEEALINCLLAINLSLKVIQAVIFSLNTYEKEMIEVGNNNEKIRNKDRCNYCRNIPILPLFNLELANSTI